MKSNFHFTNTVQEKTHHFNDSTYFTNDSYPWHLLIIFLILLFQSYQSAHPSMKFDAKFIAECPETLRHDSPTWNLFNHFRNVVFESGVPYKMRKRADKELLLSIVRDYRGSNHWKQEKIYLNIYKSYFLQTVRSETCWHSQVQQQYFNYKNWILISATLLQNSYCFSGTTRCMVLQKVLAISSQLNENKIHRCMF